MLSRRSVLKGTATAALAAGTVAMLPELSFAKAPLQSFQAPGFYRLKLGDIEITALSDGTIPLPLETLYTHTTEEKARAALAAAFKPSPTQTSINAYLVNTGERLVLIDAGTGAYLGPSLGKLAANLAASGYRAEDIDDILLTHIHTDHSGGLAVDGKRVFPNATVRVNKRDLDFWMDAAAAEKATGALKSQFKEAQESLKPYLDAGKVEAFGDNAQAVPGIGTILRAGHTPGHSSMVVESGGQKLVFWGDITHGDVLQFDEPGVAIEFDIDQDKAIKARAAAFTEAADQAYLVAGAHIAFPGIGHVRRDETNYDWVPLNYSGAL